MINGKRHTNFGAGILGRDGAGGRIAKPYNKHLVCIAKLESLQRAMKHIYVLLAMAGLILGGCAKQVAETNEPTKQVTPAKDSQQEKTRTTWDLKPGDDARIASKRPRVLFTWNDGDEIGNLPTGTKVRFLGDDNQSGHASIKVLEGNEVNQIGSVLRLELAPELAPEVP